MKFRFVLGIGRSGTTMLGRIVAFSGSPMRFLSEPFYGLKEQASPERIDTSSVMPDEAERVGFLRDRIVRLGETLDLFRDDRRFKIERDDAGAEALLVKEVHALLAFPEIVRPLEHRTVVITRDTARALDSYVSRIDQKRRRYLFDEGEYLAACVRGRRPAHPLVARALETAPQNVRRYLARPRWTTSALFRRVATMVVIRDFLRAWAESDPNVLHVRFEDLCLDPVGNGKRVFDALGLAFDDKTVAAITEMTSGSSDAYYATDKDSRKVLAQPFKALSPGRVAAVRRFAGEEA